MNQTAAPAGAFYSSRPYVIEYDTVKWPFQEILSQVLAVPALHNTGFDLPLRSRRTDTHTPLHDRFYTAWSSNAMGIEFGYRRFITDELMPRWGLTEVIAQAVPSFRAQLAGNLAVGEFHTDYGHHRCEQNFWMPFTDTDESNCVWIESEPGKGDYAPWPVDYGQILVFPGALLTHGNVQNRSHDRISWDFRLSLVETFQASGLKTINGHRSFTLGQPDSLFEHLTRN